MKRIAYHGNMPTKPPFNYKQGWETLKMYINHKLESKKCDYDQETYMDVDSFMNKIYDGRSEEDDS